jgi:hypothetical protein
MFPLCSSSTNSISRLLTATIFSYFGLVKDPEDPDRTVDPDSVWLDLCLHDDLAKLAKARCVAFLRAYVKDSEQEFPILVPLEETGEEPQETEWRRAVTSAHSLLNIWRSLIAEADATGLLKKRREDPAEKNIWKLKFMDHTNRLGQGPVYEISKVSQTSLPATITNLSSPQRRHIRHPFFRPPPPHSHFTLSLRMRTSFLSMPFSTIVADHLITNSGFLKRALLNSSYTSTYSPRR